MALTDYVRVLRRRWWIPALLTLVTVLATGLLVFTGRPTYTATAAVFAAAPTSGPARSITFPQAVTSNTLALSVIRKSKLGLSLDQLSRQIDVSTLGPNLYSVTVRDPDSTVATKLAAELAADAVVLYRQLAAQVGNSSADQALLKTRDQLALAFTTAATARLKFQVDHPSAFDPKAPVRDVDIAAQALQLQLQENAASIAYGQALAEVSRQGLDQASKAQDYNAFVLDQPVARPNTQTRVPEILFAGAVALLVGMGLAFLLEFVARKSLLEAEAVEEMIGAPVIGIIPRTNPQVLRRTIGGKG
jgi:capsular polysaccharide biosynthesis protein